MNLTQNNFDDILSKSFLFETHPKVAVAVSGGPDSMAIVFLLNKWIKQNKGSLIALIVDHRLRQDSYLEAKHIKKFLSQHRIKSELFKINKRNIIKSTMNEARENRFNQLIKFCSKNNIFHLFVAHHYDDNLETFLLRKIAGSNFEGLCGIQQKVNIGNVQVLRPLLQFNKKNILKYNNDHNIFFVNDQSNENLKYSRIVVRKFLLTNNIYKKQIEKDFKKIQNLLPFYKKMIFQIFNKLNIYISKNNVLINTNNFFKHDQEIQTKIIEIIYKFLRPKKKYLRYKKIVHFLNCINTKKILNTNLGGISIKKDVFLISFSV